jgi:recombinase/WD40 repeat protein
MSPDRRVQSAVRGVFTKFQELGSVRQVLLWYRQERILLPRIQPATLGQEVTWRAPIYNTVLGILKNPVYAGAFVHGRRQTRTVVRDGRARKTQGHEVVRAAPSMSGAQGNGESAFPSVSADGRFVAFYSEAINLVPGDGNAAIDVFVHDRETGITERVSVSSGEIEGNANSMSPTPALSADGRYVAFVSAASNLVAGDDNGAPAAAARSLMSFPIPIRPIGSPR